MQQPIRTSGCRQPSAVSLAQCQVARTKADSKHSNTSAHHTLRSLWRDVVLSGFHLSFMRKGTCDNCVSRPCLFVACPVGVSVQTAVRACDQERTVTTADHETVTRKIQVQARNKIWFHNELTNGLTEFRCQILNLHQLDTTQNSLVQQKSS
jgi:hypothetical protein